MSAPTLPRPGLANNTFTDLEEIFSLELPCECFTRGGDCHCEYPGVKKLSYKCLFCDHVRNNIIVCDYHAVAAKSFKLGCGKCRKVLSPECVTFTVL